MFQRIMVIDDQPADQMLAKYAILEYNSTAEIIEAFDGLEALSVLDQLENKPDLIFLDINMPRMNGFEFLESYDKNYSGAPIVVMLTSSDQEADRNRCALYRSVAGYESKPVSVVKLKKLENLLC